MAGKARLNKDLIFRTLLPGAGIIAAAAAFIGGFGYVAWSIHMTDHTKDPIPSLQNHNRIPGDPGTYRLSGPGQIVTQQGDYKYTFNFEALHVIIEGKEKLEPIPFKSFSNPAMIDDMKTKACTLGGSFVAAANAYQTAKARDERIQEYVNNQMTIAGAFINDHCPVQRSVPHVR